MAGDSESKSRDERGEPWATKDILHQFEIWDNYILQFETNMFSNLRQIHFTIWVKFVKSHFQIAKIRIAFLAIPGVAPTRESHRSAVVLLTKQFNFTDFKQILRTKTENLNAHPIEWYYR